MRYTQEQIWADLITFVVTGELGPVSRTRGVKPLLVRRCPQCGRAERRVYAITIPPREYEFVTGNRTPRSKRRKGYLVAMPCCGWTGWLRHDYVPGRSEQDIPVTDVRHAFAAPPEHGDDS